MIAKKIFWKCFLFSLVFAFLIFMTLWLFFNKEITDLEEQFVNSSTINTQNNQEIIYNHKIEESLVSVVSIVIKKKVKYLFEPEYEFGNSLVQEQLAEVGWGAGIVVSQKWYILTNKHVVEDIKAEYLVILEDGREYEVKNVWHASDIDLAIMKIEDDDWNSPAWLIAVSLMENPYDVPVWSLVFAVWYLLSEYKNAVTIGVLSAKWVSFDVSDQKFDGYFLTDNLLSPWSSWGPLFDINGNVIWITSAYSREGLSYILPLYANFWEKYFSELSYQ